MKFILGKKISTTRFFRKDGKSIPVTVVEAGPCFVTQIKSKEKEGYDAVQIGIQSNSFINKPDSGHLKKSNQKNLKNLKEIRIESDMVNSLKVGDRIQADSFKEGDKVWISGISKGKGFQGTVKRHNFRTGPKSHGSDNYRQPGSIGATYPQRTIKGKRMSGHMGHEMISVKNLEVADVIADKNIIMIKGAVPGVKNNIILIKGVQND